jgi:hypothetical protein
MKDFIRKLFKFNNIRLSNGSTRRGGLRDHSVDIPWVYHPRLFKFNPFRVFSTPKSERLEYE